MRLVWKGLMTALLALTLCLPAYAKKVPIGMLANPQGIMLGAERRGLAAPAPRRPRHRRREQ